MSFRFRKRFRIIPGLWIILSWIGGSLSVGGRGANDQRQLQKASRKPFGLPAARPVAEILARPTGFRQKEAPAEMNRK
jgi:hypothetical protein